MKIEVRNNQVTLLGYVNVTNRDSKPLGSPRGKFVEQMVDGVFRRALDKAENVDILFNHLEDRKLGSTSQGNLSLTEDNVGLKIHAVIDDEEVVALAKRGALKGYSFGFVAQADKWQEGNPQRRFVHDLELFEVSVLSVLPAYSGTQIYTRSENEELIKETRSYDTVEFFCVEESEETRMLQEIEQRNAKLVEEIDKFINRKGVITNE